MATGNAFEYNIAFTMPVNTPTSEPKLTAADVWLSIAHGAHSPQEFAPHAAKCDVLWRTPDGQRIGRAVTMADGGVHTTTGQVIHQRVNIVKDLLTEAKTLDNGAKTTMIVSYGPDSTVSPESTDVNFTFMYELKLPGVAPGSERAQEIERDYPELARMGCMSTVEQFRQCKRDGRLERWANEAKAACLNA